MTDDQTAALMIALAAVILGVVRLISTLSALRWKRATDQAMTLANGDDDIHPTYRATAACACGRDRLWRRRREPWMHAPDRCQPLREWLG